MIFCKEKSEKILFNIVMLILFLSINQSSLFAQIDQINYRGWVRTKTTVSDERKIALVIGNSEYMFGARLAQPANDAQTIAGALEAQGYEVEIGYNLDRNAFNEAIESFSQKFRTYDSGIVYYAGHGFQIDGENYLIPVDANPESKFQVYAQCINVEDFFKAFNQPDKPKVIILDACRNNPFVQNRNWTAEYRGTTHGMAEVNEMDNSLIVFSTEKNTVVRDDNPFTEILSALIREGGGYTMHEILGKVQTEIRKINSTQRITTQGLLMKQITFGESAFRPQSNPESKDSDGDMIPDKIDQCPTEFGSIYNNGCPGEGNSSNGDIDMDGITDNQDDCPEAAGPMENKGCPEAAYDGPFDNGTFTDARDGQTYSWVRLKDGQKWMAQNLNFKSDDSWCYDDKNKNCQKFGRLYSWNAAQSACPKGWHIPSEYEWKRIVENYGGEQSSYRSLMIEKEHNFDPILGGGRQAEEDFCCLGDFGNYWSSDNTSARATYIDFNKSNGYIGTRSIRQAVGIIMSMHTKQ